MDPSAESHSLCEAGEESRVSSQLPGPSLTPFPLGDTPWGTIPAEYNVSGSPQVLQNGNTATLRIGC